MNMLPHIGIAVLAVAAVWSSLILKFASFLGLVKANFQGRIVFCSYGIVMIPLLAAVFYALAAFGFLLSDTVVAVNFVILAACGLGVLDDFFGNRDVGGFRGHFRQLAAGHVTTGAIKAIGIGFVGLAAGVMMFPTDIVRLVLIALLIPLSANTTNLLDVRPGRSVTVFLVGIVVTYIWGGCSATGEGLLVAATVVVLLFGIADSRGRMMMGDSGSNALGALLGVMVGQNVRPVFALGAIILMVFIQVYAEKRSITALIESNRVLHSVDRFLGVR